MRALLDFLAGRTRSRAGPARLSDEPDPPAAPQWRRRRADDGIAYRPIDALLADHGELLARIKLSYGADALTFERKLLPLIRRYAEDVQALPATPDNFFSAPGGLLHLGLEIAFFALQATDGQIFGGGSTITSRRELEPRWRLATFIAGLCHPIHLAATRLVVTDADDIVWPAYLLPLDAWLQQRGAQQFFVKWLPGTSEARSVGLFALRRIVPHDILQHLADGNASVVPHMLASVAGLPVWHDENVLDRLVRRAAALVIDRDRKASEERSGKPLPVSHLGAYLVDALRRLLQDSPAWQPNADKSRVWLIADGLFIVWPNAATDILKTLEAQQLAGMPKTPQALVEALLAARIVQPRTSDAPMWPILPPGSRVPFDALRLSAPEVLLAGLDEAPEPLAASLVSEHPAAPSPIRPSAPPAAQQQAAQQQAAQQQAAQQQAAQQQAAQTSVRFDDDQAAQDVASFALRVPFTLANSVVACALAEIVESLNGAPDDAAACVTPLGLFVPLVQFLQRKVDPGTAVRALSASKMLVSAPGSNATSLLHDFRGEQLRGVVVSARFVSGLELPGPAGT